MLTLNGRLVQPFVRIAAREKQNALAVRKPGHHFVVDAHAIAERRRRSLVKRQLPGLTALGGHHVHIEIAVILSGEGNPFAVGREFRKQVRARRSAVMRRASPPELARQPKIAAVHEDDLVLVDVGKPHQPAFRHFLG